jgi:threonine dehydratase
VHRTKLGRIESFGARLRRVEGFYADALAASQDHARHEGAFHIATAVGLSLGMKTLTVADEDIAAARALLWQRLRILTERGGATALAALEHFLDGATVVVSGAKTAPSSSIGC